MKKRRMTPEEYAAWKARSERTLRMLRERIAYHERNLRAAGKDTRADD